LGRGRWGGLGRFTSAVVLGLVALLIAWESFVQFVSPREISFDQAIGVAMLGLVANVLSAWLLRDDHHHGHEGHHRDHDL